ncbi:MAG: dipeptide epimerase [Spirochaetales bacterium]|nr:dipeptide epimerase [Spirochaetales bacterium]
MKITNISWERVGCKLKKPFITALRTLDYLEVIQVVISSDSGEIGIGGCAPTAAITGETMGSLDAALLFLSEKIKGMEIEGLAPILYKIKTGMAGNTSAKAALDIALHDLYSKKLGIPLYQYLGGFSDRLSTDLTISLNSMEEMVEDANQAFKDGFKELKLKVGGDPDEDVSRIMGIREALGTEVKLRLDANQGWTVRDAVKIVNRVQDMGGDLDFVEQPVKGTDLKGMRFVRENIGVPLVADESIFSPEDAMRIVEEEAADGFNIKLMKCGGISEALKISAIAETAGLFCMVGAMMESHAGVSAAAHLAASLKTVKYADLDVPLLCSEKTEKGGIIYNGAEIRFPDLPGLGMEL